jgi:hypothetical protein
MLLVRLLEGTSLVTRVFAQAGTGAGGTGTGAPPKTQDFELPNPLGTTNFQDVLSRILSGLTIIAIPVVAIIIVVAAFQLITGGGNPEKRKGAMNMIVWSAIGFGVLLLADSVAFIVKDLLVK